MLKLKSLRKRFPVKIIRSNRIHAETYVVSSESKHIPTRDFRFAWKIKGLTINHKWNDTSPESAVGLIEIYPGFADTIEKWAIQAEEI